MKLVINGKPVDIKGDTIDDLINEMSLPREGLAVAVNNEVAPHDKYNNWELNDGDTIEIIRPIGGG